MTASSPEVKSIIPPADPTLAGGEPGAPKPRSSDNRYESLAILVLLIACAVRVACIWWFPRGPDECMYWHWSTRLDIGYVDHPPMVAYAVAMMTYLFGDTAWASRLLAIPLAAVTGWTLFCSGRLVGSPRVGFWAATLHAACPMFSMAGGIMLLPESILQLWISLALYVSIRLVVSQKPGYFYLLGLITGLALLTKYPGILVPLALGFFALCSPNHRYWFRRKEPYLMCVMALVMFAPVIVWNYQHNWAGVTFLTQRTEADQAVPGLAGAWQSLAAQAGYHSPIIFVLLLIGVIRSAWRGLRYGERGMLLLFSFSGPLIIAFLVISAVRVTLPHWPAAGYLAAYVAAPATMLRPRRMTEGIERRPRARWLAAGTAVGAVMCLAMPLLLVYPITTRAYDRLQRIINLPEETIEPMAAAYGWQEEIRDRILTMRKRIVEQTGVEPVVLTHFHLIAASLHNALRDECSVISLGPLSYQYGVWYDEQHVADQPVIFVATENTEKFMARPDDFFAFDRCEPMDDLPIIRHSVQINRAHFWICRGFQGVIGPSR